MQNSGLLNPHANRKKSEADLRKLKAEEGVELQFIALELQKAGK